MGEEALTFVAVEHFELVNCIASGTHDGTSTIALRDVCTAVSYETTINAGDKIEGCGTSIDGKYTSGQVPCSFNYVAPGRSDKVS
jgi:hypothetical protein